MDIKDKQKQYIQYAFIQQQVWWMFMYGHYVTILSVHQSDGLWKDTVFVCLFSRTVLCSAYQRRSVRTGFVWGVMGLQ